MVTIQPETTKKPITLMGKEAGVCWGGDTLIDAKNYKRGLDCVKNNHGRVMEYPQVYMVLDGYSAKVIREFYTHIGGAPTRLQQSTRYVDCRDFGYVVPPEILKDKDNTDVYLDCMRQIKKSVKLLEEYGVAKEDASMLLPMGMKTKVVVRTNLRNLVDMSRQRLCNRAFWEFRDLMRDITKALEHYDKEWAQLTDMLFHPKCVELGKCPESKSCGRKA